MELEIAGQAIIKNINVRANYHNTERELGVDLRLVMHTDADVLANFSPTLRAMLFDDANKLRMPELKPLGLTIEYEDHTLHIADLSYDAVKLSKFEITPEPEGRVQVAFTASMINIDAANLGPLALLFLDEVVNVDIEAAQGDLFKEVAA